MRNISLIQIIAVFQLPPFGGPEIIAVFQLPPFGGPEEEDLGTMKRNFMEWPRNVKPWRKPSRVTRRPLASTYATRYPTSLNCVLAHMFRLPTLKFFACSQPNRPHSDQARMNAKRNPICVTEKAPKLFGLELMSQSQKPGR